MMFKNENPAFEEAMNTARAFCLRIHEPPMTRREMYMTYRSVRRNNFIAFRCKFKVDE